jgi:hypothetical protein
MARRNLDSWPGASGLFGHSLGLAGFGLMLMTETLYTLRKRSRSARWGRMAFWLQFHIFTGLVGPYMVLLHTAWKYNGVAGMAMMLTIVIVISGFIGRYIYTAVPRTVDGAAVEAAELKQQVAATEAALQQWLSTRPEIADALAQGLTALSEAPSPTSSLVLGRIFSEWRYRRQWQRQKRQLQVLGNTHIQDLEKLLNRRQVLERQVASLAAARQMLALWHSVHVPLGVSLFTLAFIHIGGALYYATLLR